jgi:hypothetical protein
LSAKYNEAFTLKVIQVLTLNFAQP